MEGEVDGLVHKDQIMMIETSQEGWVRRAWAWAAQEGWEQAWVVQALVVMVLVRARWRLHL